MFYTIPGLTTNVGFTALGCAILPLGLAYAHMLCNTKCLQRQGLIPEYSITRLHNYSITRLALLRARHSLVTQIVKATNYCI